MPSYSATTWTNGVTACNATNMNKIETQLAAAPYSVFFLATPYLLLNGVSISSGSTNTQTATGGSTGVPTGATGILFCCYGTASAAGGWLAIKPHGATVSNNSNYPMVGLTQASGGGTPAGFGMVAVDGSGKIDVVANSQNFTSVNLSIYGYIY